MAEHGYNHQAQPSNGSLVFGGFPSSGTSSPAPHLPAGFPPATAPPFPVAEAVPVPVDMYGRPIMVPPTAADPYVNAVNSHGPPTPHSFHGSQGSNQPEEVNGFGPRPVNGHGNYPSEPLGQTQPQPYMHSQALFINHQIQDEALGALRNGLKDHEFADCTLEFRFTSPGIEPRDPLTMAAHRFVVAQSPTLRQLLRSRSFPHGVLQVEIQNEYIRPDSLYFAIRTLYGWDLGDGPHLPTFLPLNSALDAIGLALGYIATARYLQLPLVNMKAVHWASRLVRWETVELACKFALPTAALAPAQHGLPLPRDDYPISELVDSIVAFLFSSIPADFMLDTTVSDCGFARLPRVTSAPPTPLSPNAPAIAHGTFNSAKTHMPRNQRMSVNPRLTQIKFGDIAASSGGEQGSRPGTPTHARRPPTLAETILSRILLNLPFNLLKQTLEHPVFTKHATADTITRAIVAEREARRLRAMDKASAELHVLQEAVERAGKPLIVTEMGDFLVNSMGFKEEVFAGDAPYLVQTWAQGPGSAGSVGSS
ncbi:hypothetical protein GQ53DRAFT_634152 [Thozetella sp. PMI_491]|nr:hypothetical protein GQ53DRAFT_634152 [Thozetella sp. PMI_491]